MKRPSPKKPKQTMKIAKDVKEKTVAVIPANEAERVLWGTEAWSKIVSKKRKQASKKGETTYADILKQVKSDLEPKDLEINVNWIRRSQKGDLRLGLMKSNDKTAEKFLGQVEKSLGQQTEVRARRQEVAIECKDIYEVTTKEDVCAALEKVFELLGLQESAVK